MVSTELYRLSACEIRDLLRSNTITVEEYAKSLLSRVSARDNTVKAWVYLSPEYVLEQARALDKTLKDNRGPLFGIAIGIKDIMNTKDMPTEYGSPIYKGNNPTFDSAAVGILRAAGALIFGKTTTTEFAAVQKGTKTANPHNPAHTPGGSSSGSAAAVADFQVTLSVGTQTAGSIVRPASFNGIYGMKPTWNSISPEGEKTFSIHNDTFGFFARTVKDLELFADIFSLQDDEMPRSVDLKESVFAVLNPTDILGEGSKAALGSAAQLLRDSGARVEMIDLPDIFAKIIDMHTEILAHDGRIAFYKEYRLAPEKLNSQLIEYVTNKHQLSRKNYVMYLEESSSLRPQMDRLLSGYTALIAPSTLDAAPQGLEYTGNPVCNSLWTALHVPVINIPGFQSSDMPVGVSLIAPRYHDRQLLKVCEKVGEVFTRNGGWTSKV
ncbi:amidase signature enzyme [Microthyrium microscopicum]|uniref:Amidase signature enzyme n=1 Tax=Microthyrium microscopicum TaxID=703497 RepID=A0A6A6USD9_9PEZI|nr:amidase signature enzyme [Microthyrium microscopicum]